MLLRLLALGLLTGAACDRPALGAPARADTVPAAAPEAPAAPVAAATPVAAAGPSLTKPGEAETLAIFFSVSNRGELDPCG